MTTHRQALCVVNLRQHAACLYDALLGAGRSEKQRESIFHLSTRMCAQHRLDVVRHPDPACKQTSMPSRLHSIDRSWG